MVITWRADRPPACDDHGRLADRPLPALDAAVVMLVHLRDVHGKNVGKTLESLTARQAAA